MPLFAIFLLFGALGGRGGVRRGSVSLSVPLHLTCVLLSLCVLLPPLLFLSSVCLLSLSLAGERERDMYIERERVSERERESGGPSDIKRDLSLSLEKEIERERD